MCPSTPGMKQAIREHGHNVGEYGSGIGQALSGEFSQSPLRKRGILAEATLHIHGSRHNVFFQIDFLPQGNEPQ